MHSLLLSRCRAYGQTIRIEWGAPSSQVCRRDIAISTAPGTRVLIRKFNLDAEDDSDGGGCLRTRVICGYTNQNPPLHAVLGHMHVKILTRKRVLRSREPRPASFSKKLNERSPTSVQTHHINHNSRGNAE